MRELFLAVSIVALMTTISGCGGGGGDSTTESVGGNPNSPTSTTVTVERGRLLDANVTDAAGKTATALGNGRYQLLGTITYPISATGGIIDVDGDGVAGAGDYLNAFTYKTLEGDVITPITTALAEMIPVVREQWIESIEIELSMTKDDLYTLPSAGNHRVVCLSNAIFERVADAENGNFSLGANVYSTVKSSYNSLWSNFMNTPASQAARAVEQSIMTVLHNKGKITAYQAATNGAEQPESTDDTGEQNPGVGSGDGVSYVEHPKQDNGDPLVVDPALVTGTLNQFYDLPAGTVVTLTGGDYRIDVTIVGALGEGKALSYKRAPYATFNSSITSPVTGIFAIGGGGLEVIGAVSRAGADPNTFHIEGVVDASFMIRATGHITQGLIGTPVAFVISPFDSLGVDQVDFMVITSIK